MVAEEVEKPVLVEKDCYIYGLVDPLTDEIFYVGASRDPKVRLYGHIRDGKGRSKDSKSQRVKSLLRMGLKPLIVYLEIVPNGDDWGWCERFWISFGRQLGWPLTNIALGGYGLKGMKIPGASERMTARNNLRWSNPENRKQASEMMKQRVMSEESRRKISKARKGVPLSPQAKENVRRAAAARRGVPSTAPSRKGIKCSEEHKRRMREGCKNRVMPSDIGAKISAAQKGKKLSEEHKEKLSKVMSGRYVSEETKAKMAESGRKAWEKRRERTTPNT